jgi:hypothetical protein
MRRETPFTLDEAKVYIIESVKEWEDTNQEKKIISLAGNVYNQRNKKATFSNEAKLKVMVTILNATNENINRKLKLNQDANVDRLYEERDELQTEIERLESLLVEDPPKTPKIRKRLKREYLERVLVEKKPKLHI